MGNNTNIRKRPLVIDLMLFFVETGAIFTSWSIFHNWANLNYRLGPILLTGLAAKLIDLFTVAILVLIFYGLLNRINWIRKVFIFWCAFTIILSLANLALFIINPFIYDGYYQAAISFKIANSYLTYSEAYQEILSDLFFNLILQLIITLPIFFYLKREKAYFIK